MAARGKITEIIAKVTHKSATRIEVDKAYTELKNIGALNFSTFQKCLTFFARNGGTNEAVSLIEKAKSDGVTYSDGWLPYLASAIAKDGHPDQGLAILQELDQKGKRFTGRGFGMFVQNVTNFPEGLKWCMDKTRQKLAEGDKGLNTHVIEDLLEAFAAIGDMERCAEISRIPNLDLGLRGLTALLAGWGRKGELEKCMEVWDQMKQKNITPKTRTYTAYIGNWARADEPGICLDLFLEMEARGLETDAYVYNLVVGALDRAGRWEDAVVLLEKKNQKKIPTGASGLVLAIRAYARTGRFEKCKEVLGQAAEIGSLEREEFIKEFAAIGKEEEAKQFVEHMQNQSKN